MSKSINLNFIDHGRKHKKPKTRREFLSQGYIAGVGMLMTPSLLGMISQRAMGVTSCDLGSEGDSTEKPVSFICMDMAGGANIPGSNVMVGGKGGQMDFLSSYESLSLSNSVSPKTNESNVVPLNGDRNNSLMFHAQSPFLAGLISTTSDTTRSNLDGVLFCTATLDDTSANPLSPIHWINQSGLDGQLLSLVGASGTPSGGNSIAPGESVNPLKNPAIIKNADSTSGLVDLGLLGKILDQERAERIMKAVSSMSENQLNRFNKKALPEKISELIKCGYINSIEQISQFGPSQLDPRNDNLMKEIYGNDISSSDAAITKLVLDSYAGAGTTEVGGCDYHTNDFRSEGVDKGAGARAGRMFEAAAKKKKALILYVYTDGGVSSSVSGPQNGKFPWTGESGQRSGSFMLIYDPNGKPKIKNNNRQVGWYNNSGSVQTNATVISSSAANLTKLIVANYLALSGKEKDLSTIVGDNPFKDNLESMLSFSEDTLNKKT